MPGMTKYKHGEIAYLQSSLLLQEEGFIHGFSTRVGGVSQGPFTTLNTGMSTGDKPSLVLENRRRFLSLWGLHLSSTISGQAVHGLRVTRVASKDQEKNNTKAAVVPFSDGLVTSCPGLVLTSFAGDCQIIIVIDPRQKAVGIAHAGWRGVLKGMSKQLVSCMGKEFNSRPGDLKVVVGPSICFKCFEVDTAVAQMFRYQGWDDWNYLNKAHRGEKYYVNLEEITRRQLFCAGLNKESIELSNWCTYENPSLFYSHRRDRGNTGRQMGFVVLY